MVDIMRLSESIIPYKRDGLVKYHEKIIISSNTNGFYFHKATHLFWNPGVF